MTKKQIIFLLLASSQAVQINLREYQQVNAEIQQAEKIEEKEDAIEAQLEEELNEDMSETDYKNYLLK